MSTDALLREAAQTLVDDWYGTYDESARFGAMPEDIKALRAALAATPPASADYGDGRSEDNIELYATPPASAERDALRDAAEAISNGVEEITLLVEGGDENDMNVLVITEGMLGDLRDALRAAEARDE